MLACPPRCAALCSCSSCFMQPKMNMPLNTNLQRQIFARAYLIISNVHLCRHIHTDCIYSCDNMPHGHLPSAALFTYICNRILLLLLLLLLLFPVLILWTFCFQYCLWHTLRLTLSKVAHSRSTRCVTLCPRRRNRKVQTSAWLRFKLVSRMFPKLACNISISFLFFNLFIKMFCLSLVVMLI